MIKNNGIENLTATKLVESCRSDIQSAKKLLEALLAIPGPRTKENTLNPFNDLNIHLDNAASLAGAYAHLHPEKTVRTAAEKAEQEVQKFATELSLDQALYAVFRAVDTVSLDDGAKRFVEKTLLDFRRSGVDKDGETRGKIQEIQEEIVQIGQDFSRNIREDVRSIELTSAADLAGLPRDYIDSHPMSAENTIRITTDYPDYLPFMQYARNAEARRELGTFFRNRGFPSNEPILRSLLEKRYELARLLGYENWAAYILEDKMAGDPARVESFINEIAEMARSKAKQEYSLLQEVKREAEQGADAFLVENWESAYYLNKLKAEKFLFDPISIRPYFQYEKVKDGIMNLASEIFSVRFEKVDDRTVWHKSVEVYTVLDGEKGARLGRILLDMHPRDGKFKHAAQMGLHRGVKGRQLPEGVLMCNFPDPSTTKGPALMEHGQVKTFFHEFGHLLHHILAGNQEWIRFSGVATEWDFVEAPSQLLEEWVLDQQILERFAVHHQTGERIPEELVNRMREANEFGKGLLARQQMFYAMMSLRFYNENPANFDLSQRIKELEREYSPYPHMKGTHFHLSFGHLDGYSAMYYTYAWSLVIAKDLFGRFQSAGLMNESVCRRYRELVLEPGGSRDASDLIADFLGRPFSIDAYRDWMNATTKESYFPTGRVL